jgi:hypothetical protein
VSEVSLKQLDAHVDAMHEHSGVLRTSLDAAYDSPDEVPTLSFTALRARARAARDHAMAVLDLLGERAEDTDDPNEVDHTIDPLTGGPRRTGGVVAASDSLPRKGDVAGLMAAVFGTEDPNSSVERLLRDTHIGKLK